MINFDQYIEQNKHGQLISHDNVLKRHFVLNHHLQNGFLNIHRKQSIRIQEYVFFFSKQLT